jgi:PhnB protein
MTTKLNPYLSFQNNTRQAMEFYHSVFGGKLNIGTFKEFNASRSPQDDNKIMHAELDTENGMTIMASDTPSDGREYRAGTNYSISLSGDNETELRRYFEKLSAGGTVTYPLEKAPWGDAFGMLTDKFGVPWMVNIAAKKA